MKVQRRLDLYERAKFRVVVLDVVATLLVLLDERMLPTHGYIVDAHVRVMSTAQLYFVDIVKIDDMQLLLLLVIILR